MNEWVKSIAGYLLVLNIALQLLPNKKYESYVRLFVGFLLLVLVAAPVFTKNFTGEIVEGAVESFLQEQEVVFREAERESRSVLKDAQEEEANEAIVSVGKVEVKLDD